MAKTIIPFLGFRLSQIVKGSCGVFLYSESAFQYAIAPAAPRFIHHRYPTVVTPLYSNSRSKQEAVVQAGPTGHSMRGSELGVCGPQLAKQMQLLNSV